MIPTPTFPLFAIMKLVAVLEPTTNCGAPLESPFGLTDRSPQGEVEAIPKYPEEVSLIPSARPFV